MYIYRHINIYVRLHELFSAAEFAVRIACTNLKEQTANLYPQSRMHPERMSGAHSHGSKDMLVMCPMQGEDESIPTDDGLGMNPKLQ